MTIKKPVLLIGMALVLVSLIGNYSVFAINQLKTPIMLKHYYNFSVPSGLTLELHYLVNRSEEMDIQYATIGDSEIPLYSKESWTYQTLRHHKVKTLYFQLDDHFFEDMKYDEMTINQIRVFLTNGESMVMDVGEINFYKREDSPLDFKSSGGSNDNSGFGTLSVEENMNIESYEVSFINSLKNKIIYDLNLGEKKVDDQYSFPISKEKGDIISYQYHWKFKDDDPMRNHYYYTTLTLKGKDESNTPFKHPITMDYRPYFTEKDVKEIIKEAKK